MKFITAEEVAKLLKAKPKTIYAWADQGMIPSFKLNGLLRFTEDEILKWAKSCKKNGPVGYNGAIDRRPGKEG